MNGLFLSPQEHEYLLSLLNEAARDARSLLDKFTRRTDFGSQLRQIYGINIDLSKARLLISRLAESHTSVMPEIRICDESDINNARGAFSTRTNTIYLARQFLLSQGHNSSEVTGVILEEVGHFLDSQLNTLDTPGDEGEFFANTIRGVKQNKQESPRIYSEDDHSIATIDGLSLTIEQSNWNLGLLQGNDYYNSSIYWVYNQWWSPIYNTEDNFTFQISATGAANNFIGISSSSSRIDLNLELYLGSTRINQSWTTGNYDRIYLNYLNPGVYRARVFWANYSIRFGERADYKLSWNAPPSPDEFDEDRSLGFHNDTWLTATEVPAQRLADGKEIFSGLSIDSLYDTDWFKFTTTSTATADDYIEIAFDNGDGDLALILWYFYGNQYYPYVVDGKGVDSEKIILAGLPPGTYYAQVGSYGSFVNGLFRPETNYDYELTIKIPKIPQADRLEANGSNNNFDSATNLNTVEGLYFDDRLTIHNASDNDLFRFTINDNGTSDNYISVGFENFKGDLGLALYDNNRSLLGYSDLAMADTETISLAGMKKGTYFAQVYSYTGRVNDYTLIVNAPGKSSTTLSDDRYESNTFADLGRIRGFYSIPFLSIGNTTDKDRFKFTLDSSAEKGDFVGLSFNTYKASGDLDLKLYTSARSEIPIKSSTGFRNNERIDLEGLGSGPFYVEVSGFNGSTGNYTLDFSLPGDTYEENDKQSIASNLGPIRDIRSLQNLSVKSSDSDWFRFQLDNLDNQAGRGNFIRLDFSHALGDIDLELYRNDSFAGDLGSFIKNKTDTNLSFINASTSKKNYEQISLQGLEDGEYFIKIINSQGTNNNYSLTINAAYDDEFDLDSKENNTITSATDLNNDQRIQGLGFIRNQQIPLSIHSLLDIDWFKFSLRDVPKSGDFAAISFDSTQGDIDLELYGSDGTTALQRSNGFSNHQTINLDGLNLKPNTTYYLKVFSPTEATVRTNPGYQLSLNAPITDPSSGDSYENNNNPTSASDLSNNSNTFSRLSIHNKDDRDWYKFSLDHRGTSGDSVSILLNNDQGDLDFELYTGSQTTVPIKSSRGISNSEEINLAGLPAGTYYLKVFGATPTTTNSNYNLTLNLPGSRDWADSIQINGKNIENNSPNQATDLRTVEGSQSWNPLSINATGEEDWFKFTIPATSTALTKAHAATILFDQSQGNLSFNLYGTGNTTTPLRRATAEKNAQQINLAGLAGDKTYYLQVKGQTNQVTNPRYQLSIVAPTDKAGDWSEPNNLATSATNGPFNFSEVEGKQIYSGLSIDQAGDVDWFRFTTVADGVNGHSISIEFENTQQEADDLQLIVYKDITSLTTVGSSTSDSNRDSVSLEGLAAGTYYAKVYGKDENNINHNYSLIINAPQNPQSDWADKETNNNSAAKAYNLSTIAGSLILDGLSIDNSSDSDWFKFNLDRKPVRGQFARINFNHYEGDLTLELRDSASNLIGSSSTRNNSEQISLFEKVSQPGTYYLTIKGVSSATNPSYSLSIDGIPQLRKDEAETHMDRFNNDTANSAFDLKKLGDIRNSIETRNIINQTLAGISSTLTGSGGGLAWALQAGSNPIGNVLYNQINQGFTPSPNSYRSQSLTSWGYPALAQQTVNRRNITMQAWKDPIPSASYQYSNNFYQPSNYFYPPSNNNFYRTQISSPQLVYNYSPPRYNNYPYAPSYNSYAIRGPQNIGDLQAKSALSIEANDQDWFKFELPEAGGQEGQFIGINFDNDLGNLKLDLFDAFNLVTPFETADGRGDSEQISLAGLAKGTYYARISGVNGATNPDYTLLVNVPPATAEPDWFDARLDNTLEDFGTVAGFDSRNNLSIHSSDTDWFQFTIQPANTSTPEGFYARIDFDNSLGDLDLALYNANGSTLLKQSSSSKDFEEISLAGLAAGTYRMKVSGYQNTTNPSYALSILAPEIIQPDALEPNGDGDRSILSKQDVNNAIDLKLFGDAISSFPLTIHAKDEDFFKFTVPPGITTSDNNTITIQFTQAQGDLNLELYKQTNPTPTLVKSVSSTTGFETISLKDANLTTGETYLIRVVGKDEKTSNNYQLFANLPQAAATSGTSEKLLNDWTVLVYMTGSDLNQYAFQSINEMEIAAASLPNTVNFAVLWDQSPSVNQRSTYATGGSTSPWSGTGVSIIQPDSDSKVISSTFRGFDGLSTTTSLDLNKDAFTGDPKTLEHFIKWATAAAPANNYSLILWDHGSGDLGGFNVDNEGNSAQINADRLFTEELTQAISASGIGNKLKLIAFDACLMAMAEVAYALRSYADIFVGSQEVETAGGWNYATAFSSLLANASQASASDIATDLVNNYQAKFQGDRRGWDTLSAIDLNQLKQPVLVNKLNAFTTQARQFITAPTTINANLLHSARDAATSFFGVDYLRDMGQFLEAIASNSSITPSLQQAAKEANDALDQLIVAKAADKRNTSGLSIFLPNTASSLAQGDEILPNASKSHLNYTTRNSDFLNQTGWKSFLDAFVAKGDITNISADWAENNDVAPRSFDFHTLAGVNNQFTGLNIHRPGDIDWYRFKLATNGQMTVSVSNGLTFNLYQLTTEANKPSRAKVSGTLPQTSITLANAVAGDYLVEISGGSSSVPDYTLSLNTPGSPSNDWDWVKGNDSVQKAKGLGTISTQTAFTGFYLDATNREDWFSFELPKLNGDRISPVQLSLKITGILPASAQLFLASTDPTQPPTAVTPLQTATGQVLIATPDPLPGKTYLLKISQPSNQAIAYNLVFAPTAPISRNPTAGDDSLTGGNSNDSIAALAGNDIIKAGNGNDTLLGGEGHDTLWGEAGNDTLTGNAGNDSLVGGTGTDRVVETGNVNFILTNTTLTGNGSDSLNTIEQAQLTGGNGNNQLNASTFSLGTVILDGGSGNDTLMGGSQNDTLKGGTGNDRLIGGTGMDTVEESGNVNFLLTNTTLSGNGSDIISSIEKATLTGGVGPNTLNASAFTLGSVILNGGAGDDTLIGSEQNDTLIGGSGADRFTFNRPFSTSDALTDFSSSQNDRIALSAAGFGAGLIAGVNITSAQFVLGTTALDENDRLIYNQITGALIFDRDGNGTLASLQIAALTTKPSLSAANFLVTI